MRIVWRIRSTDFEEPYCGQWLMDCMPAPDGGEFTERLVVSLRIWWTPRIEDAMLFLDEDEANAWLRVVDQAGQAQVEFTWVKS